MADNFMVDVPVAMVQAVGALFTTKQPTRKLIRCTRILKTNNLKLLN